MLAPQGNVPKTIGLLAAVASLSNFLEGYSSSYPNTAGNSFQLFINSSYIQRHGGGNGMSTWSFTWFWSLLLNIWFVGYLFGTFATPYIADNYGRKSALLIANVGCLIATLISVTSICIRLPELLIFGRAFGAAASGVSFGSLILFLQETTPTSLRGTCSFLSEVSYIAVNVIGMGLGMDVLLGTQLEVLIGVGTVPGILSILILLPMKESPKYLLINRNNRKAALESLRYYRGDRVNHDEILEEISKEVDCDDKMDLPPLRALLEVVRQPYLRRAMTIGILSLQIVVGIWPIVYISTQLLETHFEVKIAQYSSFAFICANFVASIVGMCVVERCGRRPMLIYCGIANTLCLCAYVFFDRTATYYSHHFKYGCVLALICYGMTYGAALGPIAFFITSELVPQRFRSLAQSIVFAVNTIINFTFSFLTLPLYQLINVWSFVPLFIIPSIFAIVYLFLYMPETKGREVHVIVAELIRNSSKSSSSIIVSGLSPPDSLTRTIMTSISEEDLQKSVKSMESGAASLDSINLNLELSLVTRGGGGFYADNLAMTSINNTSKLNNCNINISSIDDGDIMKK